METPIQHSFYHLCIIVYLPIMVAKIQCKHVRNNPRIPHGNLIFLSTEQVVCLVDDSKTKQVHYEIMWTVHPSFLAMWELPEVEVEHESCRVETHQHHCVNTGLCRT